MNRIIKRARDIPRPRLITALRLSQPFARNEMIATDSCQVCTSDPARGSKYTAAKAASPLVAGNTRGSSKIKEAIEVSQLVGELDDQLRDRIEKFQFSTGSSLEADAIMRIFALRKSGGTD